MKNNKYLTIYSILVSVIFIATIACFGINLYREYSGGYVRTQKTFSGMSQAVKNTLETTNEYSPDFQSKMEAAVGAINDYAALEILKNGSPIFSYFPSASIPSESTNMIKLYYNNLKAGDDGIYIVAAMYTLRPTEIVKHAKIAFVIILIFTAITILIIIYLNVFTKTSSTELIIEKPADIDSGEFKIELEDSSNDELSEMEKSEDETITEDTSSTEYDDEESDINTDDEEDISETVSTESESEQEIEKETSQNDDKENQAIPPVEESAIGIKSEQDGEFESYDIPVIEGDFSDESDSEEDISGTEKVEEEQVSETPVDVTKEIENTDAEQPAIIAETETNAETEQLPEEKAELPVDDEKPAKIESSDSQGLVSPETGFGAESYLLTRLDNELVRASSHEFDLILFLIKIKDIDRKSEAVKEISTLLVNSFQFKDLIFEYKDDCFAAIKTNCSIDDAIPLADNLHNEISSIISESGGKCYIGMTSRTIRIVSATRLLKEADSALAHAQEDEDSPIIAFRANAEKYLEFVDKKDR